MTQPKTLLYPRDPSLDPQLVWKGKDEQDRQPLEVPSVPIYIQEHINPKALIEDLRATSSGRREQQLDLFGDFNGMEFEERVEFYQHPMKWSNRMILGDSLLVMTSLAEKEGLKGQVQMIYVDPPYGIKFGSNWQVRTDRRDVKDGKLDDATRQPEQVKAFRDTWELGIHSYLSYLRDRFVVARDLLTDSGSIFVQIGDENVHLVRSAAGRSLRRRQLLSAIVYKKTTGRQSELIVDLAADSTTSFGTRGTATRLSTAASSAPRQLATTGPLSTRGLTLDGGSSSASSARNRSRHGGGGLLRTTTCTSRTAGPTTLFDFEFDGRVLPAGKGGWKTNEQGMARLGGRASDAVGRTSIRPVSR